MNWLAEAVKAGYVHPDQVAGNTGNAVTEFYSGQMLIYNDGMGAWNAADAQKGQAANKAYTRASFDMFTAERHRHAADPARGVHRMDQLPEQEA